MPIREFACETETCPEHGVVRENYFRNSDPDPTCEACGAVKKARISRFGIVWTGPLTTRYNDPKLESAHREGHWAYRRNTPSGKPEPVFISTPQESREFARSEGLVSPFDSNAPPLNMEISGDGKSATTCGQPGAWV
jgi:predicted nucleic acid-binding Zn ribbon protein